MGGLAKGGLFSGERGDFADLDQGTFIGVEGGGLECEQAEDRDLTKTGDHKLRG